MSYTLDQYDQVWCVDFEFSAPRGERPTPGCMVAREYRIPAVVGVGMATSTISDGQTLEVDGDAGTVRIVN